MCRLHFCTNGRIKTPAAAIARENDQQWRSIRPEHGRQRWRACDYWRLMLLDVSLSRNRASCCRTAVVCYQGGGQRGNVSGQAATSWAGQCAAAGCGTTTRAADAGALVCKIHAFTSWSNMPCCRRCAPFSDSASTGNFSILCRFVDRGPKHILTCSHTEHNAQSHAAHVKAPESICCSELIQTEHGMRRSRVETITTTARFRQCCQRSGRCPLSASLLPGSPVACPLRPGA